MSSSDVFGTNLSGGHPFNFKLTGGHLQSFRQSSPEPIIGVNRKPGSKVGSRKRAVYELS